MTTTTSYGSWFGIIDGYSNSPEAYVDSVLMNLDADRANLLLVAGAGKRIKKTYRDAINNALPAGVNLIGIQFTGPAYPVADEWDGFPTRIHDGSLDILAIVDSIDLDQIIDAHDVITAHDIGKTLMGSKSKTPANVANTEMRRRGVKPVAVEQIIPGRGRRVSIYNRAEVTTALANRPGSGNRTASKEETA